MPRIYVANWTNISVAAAQDLHELNCASNKVLELIGLEMINHGADVGDAEEEILRILFILGATTSGSGGGTVTPEPTDDGDAAFSGTAERNNTTVATGGSPATKFVAGWNVRAPGPVWLPVPEGRIVVPGGGRLQINLPDAPADAVTCSSNLVFKEIG